MMVTDRNALLCDFAETYGVLDMRALPVQTAAVLAAGLRDDSRIKMKLSGIAVQPEVLLLAAAVDRLSFLAWSKTEDAETGENHPGSIVDLLTGKTDEGDLEAYDTAEEFEKARAAILGGED